jgi:hypothetical protein
MIGRSPPVWSVHITPVRQRRPWASLSKFPALLILRAVQRAAAVRWRAGRETVHLSDWRLPGGVSLGKRHGQATLWKRLG